MAQSCRSCATSALRRPRPGDSQSDHCSCVSFACRVFHGEHQQRSGDQSSSSVSDADIEFASVGGRQRQWQASGDKREQSSLLQFLHLSQRRAVERGRRRRLLTVSRGRFLVSLSQDHGVGKILGPVLCISLTPVCCSFLSLYSPGAGRAWPLPGYWSAKKQLFLLRMSCRNDCTTCSPPFTLHCVFFAFSCAGAGRSIRHPPNVRSRRLVLDTPMCLATEQQTLSTRRRVRLAMNPRAVPPVLRDTINSTPTATFAAHRWTNRRRSPSPSS